MAGHVTSHHFFLVLGTSIYLFGPAWLCWALFGLFSSDWPCPSSVWLSMDHFVWLCAWVLQLLYLAVLNTTWSHVDLWSLSICYRAVLSPVWPCLALWPTFFWVTHWKLQNERRRRRRTLCCSHWLSTFSDSLWLAGAMWAGNPSGLSLSLSQIKNTNSPVRPRCSR